jgi:hypothetical protein
MSATHAAATCRWATPTLFLADAQWLDAWDYSWSCQRHGIPRVLRAPEDCATCGGWEARADTTSVRIGGPEPSHTDAFYSASR